VDQGAEGRLAATDDLGEAFFRLTRGANADRVTVYAIQASGLTNSGPGSVSERGFAFRGGGGQTSFDTQSRTEDRAGLAFLADETGGRLVTNTNRFADELGSIGRELGHYYSLAYRPPHGGDRMEHTVKVDVTRSGAQVRFRQGYRDKGFEERLVEHLDAAIFLGLLDNPLNVRLGAATLRSAEEKGKLRLPLHILVPRDSLVYLPGPDGETAQVDLRLRIRDEKQRLVLMTSRSAVVPKPAADGPDLIEIPVAVDLAPGIVTVGLSVRDVASGEISVLATSLELVPAPGSKKG